MRAPLSKLAALIFLASWPALCGDWNPRLAAQYLDSRQKEWSTWAPAAGPGGTCFSCHTGMTYLLVRPALRRALGESQATAYEKGLLDGLRARVARREAKDVSRSFTREPAASQALGVESIFAALFLARDETGQEAFDRLWSFQLQDGKARGAWPWFQLALDPWEMPESPFYGAALAALAVGTTPAEYQERKDVQERIAALTAYLRNAQQAQPLHNRIMLLWASTAMPGVLPEANRKALIEELLGKQQADGGWTMASLGPWAPHAQAPDSTGSNSYATGFATFVLLRGGVAAPNPKVARALEWLRAHQDSRFGYWEAASMNKHYEPGSMQDRFMRDAATGFAALALLEAGEPQGK